MNTLSVAGRYVIEQVAGSGGMARVWRADDARGHGRVAIKRILDELKGDAEVRAMFDDEAAITASIAHPNVVSLLDRGVDAEGPWLALEWVDGLNAHEIVATRKAPLGVRAALSLGVDLLHALAATHGPGVGVIHRDVAPSNVLVGLDGVARLADYGLARSIARARVNAAGTAKGKIGYLPPEVLRGSIHGTRGDLYGAGAVLWELLAGATALRGRDEQEHPRPRVPLRAEAIARERQPVRSARCRLGDRQRALGRPREAPSERARDGRAAPRRRGAGRRVPLARRALRGRVGRASRHRRRRRPTPRGARSRHRGRAPNAGSHGLNSAETREESALRRA